MEATPRLFLKSKNIKPYITILHGRDKQTQDNVCVQKN